MYIQSSMKEDKFYERLVLNSKGLDRAIWEQYSDDGSGRSEGGTSKKRRAVRK